MFMDRATAVVGFTIRTARWVNYHASPSILRDLFLFQTARCFGIACWHQSFPRKLSCICRGRRPAALLLFLAAGSRRTTPLHVAFYKDRGSINPPYFNFCAHLCKLFFIRTRSPRAQMLFLHFDMPPAVRKRGIPPQKGNNDRVGSPRCMRVHLEAFRLRTVKMGRGCCNEVFWRQLAEVMHAYHKWKKM